MRNNSRKSDLFWASISQLGIQVLLSLHFSPPPETIMYEEVSSEFGDLSYLENKINSYRTESNLDKPRKI